MAEKAGFWLNCSPHNGLHSGACNKLRRKARRKGGGNKDIALLGILIIALGLYALFYAQLPQGPIGNHVAGDNSIKKFASYDELESFLKSSREGYGIGAYDENILANTAGGALKSSLVQRIPDSASAPKSTASEGALDFSKTNIQVEGVDEADIVKNDGKYIYAVSQNKVFIADAYPAETAKIASVIDINAGGAPNAASNYVNEIFINNNRLIVLGQSNYAERAAPASDEGRPLSFMDRAPKRMEYKYPQRAFAKIYDISNKENPSLLKDISIDGNYYGSRMIGDYVYIIANQYISYENYGSGKIAIPQVYSGSNQNPGDNGGNGANGANAPALVQTAPAPPVFPDIYYFDTQDTYRVFITIAAIDVQDLSKEPESKIFIAGAAQSMYVSEKNIYITYTKYQNEADYIEKIVDEAILPLVPSDVANKIKLAMALSISKQTKMRVAGEIVGNYMSSLGEADRTALAEKMQEKLSALQKEIAKQREKTVVQKISIEGGNIEYSANGEVPGTVLNQFSMDEHNGYFRIATTTREGGYDLYPVFSEAFMQAGGVKTQTQAVKIGSEIISEISQDSSGMPAHPVQNQEQFQIRRTMPTTMPATQNNIYVLESGLKIAGKLEDLAPGERIYSVRFMGNKAYMVTFKQIDPLFVIDLASPENPKVLGYLKIPGVSDYMHPYDENHIIGIGREATEEGRIQGMKLSLFDVSDVSNPREISKYVIGERGTNSEALNDHKAFLFSRERSLLVLPVQVTENGKWNAFQGAYVFNLDLTGGFKLKGKITHNKYSAASTDSDYYGYDYNAQIRRSLYIGNTLYTFSQKMLKANSLVGDLGEISSLNLV